MKKTSAINDLLNVMAKLRSPTGCPWDREQSHLTLRRHAIEEVYELIDAIEAEDDHEMAEELGDLLLQVVFHCQLARERGAFDFDRVCRLIVEKLVRRHPHVFGKTKVKGVDEVWANWEKIKHAEKKGRATNAPPPSMAFRNICRRCSGPKNSSRKRAKSWPTATIQIGSFPGRHWQRNCFSWQNTHSATAGRRRNC